VTKQLSEAQEVQKKIRDMELELARIKATYPAENVRASTSIIPDHSRTVRALIQKRMTITQAEEILDQQTEEMQRLTEEQEEATQSAEEARTKVARTAKDVSIALGSPH
jgi:microcystin-dependent protein